MILLALWSYLDTNTSLHILNESTFSFHIHFLINALLKLPTSLILRPLSLFGLLKVSYLIQEIFFSLLPHPNRNILYKYVISLAQWPCLSNTDP